MTDVQKNKVLYLISEWCKNDCSNNLNCSEEYCVLYNIEKIVSDNK